MMQEPQYISHLKRLDIGDANSWVFQSNEVHQQGVALLTQKFASAFGCARMGYIIGQFHDIGKEQDSFQLYIRKVSGFKPDLKYAGRTPHAFIGALVVRKLYPHLFPLLSYPIASHHTGLSDSYDFNAKMNDDIPSGVRFPVPDFTEKDLIPTGKSFGPDDLNHFIRLLFSCLVDADYLDTERFMNENNYFQRGNGVPLTGLLPRLVTYLAGLSENSPQTELNQLRRKIQHLCGEKSIKEPGFYSLTVPTGGGKTLSSLLWAVKHAVKYGKDRIIIVIPYTSIIVQTAAILRKIFGDENVCEHHSSFDFEEVWKDKPDSSQLELQQRLASENWDYPIIVTTNVRFFESLFGNKPSVCRKLHNIANSVVILDEIQTLPREYLQPIVNAMDSYQRLFGVSFLFTTASQPILSGNHQGTNNLVQLYGLKKVEELIPNNWNLHDKLRRVNIHIDDFRSHYDDIVHRLTQYDKVLCIVNTRNDAFEIFSRMPQEGLVFHLSRRMCPLHIRQTIERIREALNDTSNKIIRVISTQLIEAGVDIDFPVVFRQEAGLDSILQAAGRCNREGRLGIADTYVFNLDKPLPKGSLSEANEARKSMGKIVDWLSPQAMTTYFRQLYCRCNSFDEKGVIGLLRQNSRINEMDFEQAAQAFKLIEERGRNVIVNYVDSLEFVAKIKKNGFSYELSKKIGNFMVNINERDFQSLLKQGLLEEVIEGIYLLPDREQYSSETGLTTHNHWLDEILIQ